MKSKFKCRELTTDRYGTLFLNVDYKFGTVDKSFLLLWKDTKDLIKVLQDKIKQENKNGT